MFRVLKGVPYVSVLPTATLTPTWDPMAPDTLTKVTERYKVRGADLVSQGYSIPPDAGAATDGGFVTPLQTVPTPQDALDTENVQNFLTPDGAALADLLANPLTDG